MCTNITWQANLLQYIHTPVPVYHGQLCVFAPSRPLKIQRMLIDVLITHRCTPLQRASLNPRVPHTEKGWVNMVHVLTGVNSSNSWTGARPRWIWNLSTHHRSLRCCQTGKLLVTLYLCLHLESSLEKQSEWGATADTRGIQRLQSVKRLIAGITTVMRCSTFCLPLAVRAARSWRVGDRKGAIHGNAQSLFAGRLVQWAVVRLRGCVCSSQHWGSQQKHEEMASCRAAFWPFVDQSARTQWFHTKLEGFKGAYCDVFNSLCLQPHLKLSRGNVATCRLHWNSIPCLLWAV